MQRAGSGDETNDCRVITCMHLWVNWRPFPSKRSGDKRGKSHSLLCIKGKCRMPICSTWMSLESIVVLQCVAICSKSAPVLAFYLCAVLILCRLINHSPNYTDWYCHVTFESINPTAYRFPAGEKRACISHTCRPTVYGKIRTWKRDILYLTTHILSSLYITACVHHRSNVKRSIFSPCLSFCSLTELHAFFSLFGESVYPMAFYALFPSKTCKYM